MEMDDALAQAADEDGLAEEYRACVRPLLREPYVWPRCCGGGCEPCAEQLIRVASRALRLCGREPPAGR